MAETASEGNGAPKQDAIVRHLREAIMRGEWGPGARLPTRQVLRKQYSTTSATVQRVFDRLIADGFVETRGARGSFVAERLPHLYRHVLVFPVGESDSGWGNFWAVMRNLAPTLAQERGIELQVRFGVEDGGPSGGEARRRLREDLRERRIAGLIFATTPLAKGQSLLGVEPAVPRVIIGGCPKGHRVAAVSVGGAPGFSELAVRYLLERGRKRIAVIGPSRAPSHFDDIAHELGCAGLSLPPHWRQGVELGYPAWAENVARLLFLGGGRERPDGLIVTDDNLVEYAVAGLLASGVRVPEQVEMVAHCNFPAPRPNVIPMARLGYDIHALLSRCLDTIDLLRHGGTVPPRTMLSATFEWDLPVRKV